MADCITGSLIGKSNCDKMPKGVRQFILTGDDYTFPIADLNNTTFWDSAFLSDEPFIVLFENVEAVEDISQEAGVETLQSGRDIRTQPRKYKTKVQFSRNLEIHKSMNSWDGFSGRLIEIDVDGQMFAEYANEGKTAGRGFKLDNFFAVGLENRTLASATLSGFTYGYSDHKALDQNSFLSDYSATIISVVRRTPYQINLTSAATATGFTFTVNNKNDNTLQSGLIQADFTLVDSGGVDQSSAITSIVEVSGVYTLVGTGIVAGDIGGVSASTISIPGVDIVDDTSFTI